MKALITGTSAGIGRACAELFLQRGWHVYGFDIAPASIAHAEYEHFVVDVRDPRGVSRRPRAQRHREQCWRPGRRTTSPLTCRAPSISPRHMRSWATSPPQSPRRGFVRLSMSARRADTRVRISRVCGEQGRHSFVHEKRREPPGAAGYLQQRRPGRRAYRAQSPRDGRRRHVERIMQLTPLRRWAEPDEIAEWVYFVGVTNRFMTGQNLLIDGGEAGAAEFVWPKTSRTRTKRKGSLCRLGIKP